MSIVSYAQNFEDVMLWRALSDVVQGSYIDIGAQHPIVDSVSKAFYDQGWRGIHVEPTMEYANLLRSERPDETVVQAVVAENSGVMKFYDIEGTGLSTARQDIAEDHRSKLNFPIRETLVMAISLDDLLNLESKNDVHWLKVDVEGFERQVFSGWINSPKRPWVIVVEATYPNTQTDTSEEWEDLVLDKGYRLVYGDGLNKFYLHNGHVDRASAFNFPPNYFDHFQMSGRTHITNALVQRHREELTELKAKIDISDKLQTQNEIAMSSLVQEIGNLQSTLQNSKLEITERERLQHEAYSQARDELWRRTQSQLQTQLERERELGERLLQHQETTHESTTAMHRASVERESALQQELALLRETLAQSKLKAVEREAALQEQATNKMKLLEQETLDCRKETEALAGKLAIENLKLLQLTSALETNRKSEEKVRTELDNLLQSWSWRLTAPFRMLSGYEFRKQYVGSTRPLRKPPLSILPEVATPDHDALGHQSAQSVTENSTRVIVSDAVIATQPNTAPESQTQGLNCMSSALPKNLNELLALSTPSFIDHAYRLLLNRSPDLEGKNYYSGRLLAGYGRTSVLAQLANSTEASQTFGELLADDPNKAFIAALYQRYLGRHPDSAGLQHYLNLLKDGTSRKRIVSDIRQSHEAKVCNTIWLQIDMLIEDEHISQRWFSKFFCRTKRINKKINVNHEILSTQLSILFDLNSKNISQIKRLEHSLERLESNINITKDVYKEENSRECVTQKSAHSIHPNFVRINKEMEAGGKYGYIPDRIVGQVDIDDFLVGAYPVERTDQHSIRWIGKEAKAYLFVSKNTLCIIGQGLFEERILRLSINGTLLGDFVFGLLPTEISVQVDGWLGKNVVVDLQPQGVFNPWKNGLGGDRRDLGLLVNSIYFE